MPTEAERACLECRLLICDDGSRECGLVKITREKRREYFAEYYQANRDKKLAAAKERAAAAKRPLTKHQRFWRTHKQDPEWIANHRDANSKAARLYRSRKRSESSCSVDSSSLEEREIVGR
jgi:hypothetical protein